MNAHVTMFEIAGFDPAGNSLAGFYTDALGLTSTPHPADPAYAMVPPSSGSIAGFIVGAGSAFDTPSYAVFYVHVDDVDATAERITRAGGRILAGPMDYGPVRAAHVCDPAGNRFGIYTGDGA